MQTFKDNVYASGISGPSTYVSGISGPSSYVSIGQGVPYVTSTLGSPYVVSCDQKPSRNEIKKKVTVSTGDFQVTEQLDYVLLDRIL